MHEVEIKWQQFEKQVTCLICDRVYTDPHTVPCLHAFCKNCISKETKEFTAEVFCCPVCNLQFAQDQILPMSTNAFIDRLMDISQTRKEFKSDFLYRKCDRCNGGYSAIMWCRKCKNSHCSACKIVHDTWKEFKSHHNKVITAEEYLQDPNEILMNEASKTCGVHAKQPLDLYCKTCGMLVCRDCVTKCHPNHEFDHNDEMVSKLEEKVKGIVDSMKQLLSQILNRLQEIQHYETQASSILYINEPSIIDSVDGRVEERQLVNESDNRITLIMIQKRKATIIEGQLANFLEFCGGMVNTKLLFPFNNWVIKRADDVVTQANLYLLTYTVEVTRVGYWVKLIVTLRDVYGFPVPDQSENLKINCTEEGFVQNLEIEEQSDGVYHIWYIPNRKETHSLSVYWTKSINNTEKKQITVNTTENVGVVNRYELTDEFVWLKSKHRDEIPNEYFRPQSKHLQFPYLMAVGPNSELIVNDDSTDQLVVFDHDFKHSYVIGRKDFFDIKNITGITVNKLGLVFVADQKLDCIQKFKLDGRWICKFGQSGSGKGEFKSPHGLLVSQSEHLFVCDRHNHRIQVFKNEKFDSCFGKHGAEPGAFNEPIDVAMNSNEDQIFVTDTCNHRVQMFSPQGQFLKVFGNFANISAQLLHPCGIYYTQDKYLLVSSFGTNSVLVFKEDGTFFLEIKGTYQGNQRFTTPCGIVMLKNRHIVIASHYKHRLIVY